MTSREPIAIVGIGCRMPGGATSPESFWRLLCDGVDAVSEVPSDRWHWPSVYHPEPGTPGKLYVRRGGFIDGVDLFDAQFFNISRREAAWADPQQRLLLEVAYEALEDAGLPLEAMAGSPTGVFIGISTYDYGAMQGRTNERFEIDAYTSLGSALCVTANRLSYFFDLHGPSMAVDTACSSSLVATHLACRSIWNGEASMALVGGVNLLLQPEGTIGFCQAKMLAADGRCKSFDAGADGYVRAEGAGVVVLKPVSQAVHDNDRIYAVIRGTCVNQDGRTAGITVPSESAQAAMLTDAYRQAGIPPHCVQYMEAHGTGTSVGDPIEVHAIGKALGTGRPDGAHCLIGSVKSNFGHLEAASGVAGLIKAALCVHRERIPPNLHFSRPNPNIPFEELKLRVVQEVQDWPRNGHDQRVAGVNSFGFGGTNAHVVLTSGPTDVRRRSVTAWSEGRALLVPMSARSSPALKALAQSHVARWSETEPEPIDLADIAHSAAFRRTHHEYRAALVAHSIPEFVELAAAFAGDPAPVEGVASGTARQLVFVFSGMGPQWWGMGRQLWAQEPVFREAIEQCDRALRAHVSWSLVEEMHKDESQSRINETYIAQPAIFAIQVALGRLWTSWGVRADAVLGHSLGEVAAAHYAGILSLEDAVALVYHRSRLQHLTSGEGRMLSVSMPVAEIENIVSSLDGRISIAAYNSPESVTLSGDAATLQEVADHLTGKEVFNRFLKVDVPYHSRAMDRLQLELVDSLRTLSPRPATLKLISTLTGDRVGGEEMTADYWWRSMRYPVRFRQAVSSASQDANAVFLEIGPHPVLSASISECAAASSVKTTVLSSLRRNEPERATMLSTVGRLYSLGFPVQWNLVNGDVGRFVSLPRYPWQKERYWHETDRSARERIGERIHPLLAARGNTARACWTTDLNHFDLAFLDDHQVERHVVYPAAAYLEMALESASQLFGEPPYVIEDLAFEKAMLLPRDGRPEVQFVVGERASDFEIFSRARATGSPWERHAAGKFYDLADGKPPERRSMAEIREQCTNPISRAECYRQFEARGLCYGPRFQGIQRLWAGNGEAVAQVELDDSPDGDTDGFLAHPSLVDASFQVLLGALLTDTASSTLATKMYLPVKINSAVYHGKLPPRLWVHARLVRRSDRRLVGDIDLLNDEGETLLAIRGFTCQHVDRSDAALHGGLYQYRWNRHFAKGSTLARRADDLPAPSEIMTRLHAMGDEQFWRNLANTCVSSPEISDLARAYVFEAFARMEWRPRPGERFSTAEISNRLGIARPHDRLFHRLLTSLAAEGYVREADGHWTIVREFIAPPSHKTWKSLWDQFPSEVAELTLLRRCGKHLDGVLRGELNGLDLIFPGGSSATAEHLYQDSPGFRNCNRIVQKAVATAVQRMPEGRELRILEIGGGTGGMTTHVLSELPAKRTRYVFTDVGPLLLSQAEQRFGRHPYVEFATLDIEKNPIDQGFEAHSFDLVLASDVLHATADLRRTVENVKQLLASRGLLILLEGTMTPTPLWGTLMFGLLKGWWLFTDTDLREADPWISSKAWQDLLTSCGFDEATDLTKELKSDESVHSVLAARGPTLAPLNTPRLDQATQTDRGTWLILSDGGDVGSDLMHRLRSAGHNVLNMARSECESESDGQTLRVRCSHKDDMRRALDTALKSSPALKGIVHLWGLDLPSADDTDLPLTHAARTEVLASTLHLVQCLGETSANPLPRLLLFTRGAESAPAMSADVALEQSPLWGLGRVVMTEYPQLRCKMVDLDPDAIDTDALLDEVLNDDNEEEVAWRNGSRYVHRYDHVAPAELSPIAEADPANKRRPYAVAPPVGGSLDNLMLQPAPRVAPKPGQVEVEVQASGLNFKDVMLAMGLYPDDALESGFTGRNLGMECAGTIVAIGDGVRGLKVGDAVVACGPGTLRSHLTLDARFVAPMPKGMSFEDAATMLIAYLTAYYGLVNLARLQRGERVLIHAATGGVGLAAVQLAQHLGAEIFATAGTDEKRELLKSLGVPHVLNSRTLSFADEILERTGGQGVDVVLNSLSGDAIPKSLAILRPYGRFVEIGKRDIYEDSKVGLRTLRNNLSFFVLDMDGLCAQRPDTAREVFDEVMKLLIDKTLRPLPHRVFPVDRVQDAFRYMAQARHVGKVVVSLRDAPISIAEPSLPPRFQSNGTYLITGGMGGFGLSLAEWLIGHGAGHVALMSRRGAPSEEVRRAMDTMQNDGAEVRIFQGDVSSEQDVRRVLAGISDSMPSLRGVFHAAMVLDDAPMQDLTVERFDKVLAPKADGAWNLHRLTRDVPLDHFVLFSSLASQIGSPGQANYVAANAFLDALARHRRAAGLPALTVNWGALGDVGYVAENPDVARRLEAIGLIPLPAKQMLATLAMLMQRRAVQVGVGQFDWKRITSSLNLASSPRFAHLMVQHGGEESADGSLFDLDAILRADPAERVEILQDRLRDQLARVLGTTSSRLDVNQSLMNLGMDSLMAVEMRNRIRAELEVDVPPAKFMEGISLRGMALFVLGRLAELHTARFKGPATTVTAEAPAAFIHGGNSSAVASHHEEIAAVNELSDEEVNVQLRRLLTQAKGT